MLSRRPTNTCILLHHLPGTYTLIRTSEMGLKVMDLVDRDDKDSSRTFMWVYKDVGCCRTMKNDNSLSC